MEEEKGSVVLTAVFPALGFILCFSRPPLRGNPDRGFRGPAAGTADFSFYAGAGDRTKLPFASRIPAGTLDVVLYDFEGNAGKRSDEAKALETFAALNAEDTYTLRAECRHLVGKLRGQFTGLRA